MSQTHLNKRLELLNRETLPKHIAVIMDGNGRWANAKGMPRVQGHRQGAQTAEKLLDTCLELEIPYVSLYAFSTENWRRPQTEVKYLFTLINEFIRKKLEIMVEKGVKIVVSGEIAKLPKNNQLLIEKAIEKTKDGKNLIANFCINYGGRDDILQAIQQILRERFNGNDVSEILRKPTSQELEEKLYTAGLPEVDLMIRTAGEKRISNFLLYQAAYAELYFTNVNWPDFDEHELYAALLDYQKRNRKFGSLGDDLGGDLGDINKDEKKEKRAQ